MEKERWISLRDRLAAHDELLVVFFSVFAGLVRFVQAPFPKRDPLTYLAIVQYWVETGSYAAVVRQYPHFGRLPFSLLPIKWSAELGLPLWPVSIVWMFVLNAVTAWVFYRIVRQLTTDRSVALWCGVFFAFHPAILRHAGFVMRDTPYLMFCLLCVWSFIESVRQRKWYCELLTGASCAMAILSRYEALELLPLLPICWCFYVFHRHFSRREAVKFAGLMLVGFVTATAVMLLLVGDFRVLPESFMAATRTYLLRFGR